METHPYFEDPKPLLEHQSFARNLAKSLLFDEASAEDVVQNAWLVALQNAPKNYQQPRGWIAAVVRNLSIKMIRTRERQRRREETVATPETVVSPETIIEKESLRREIVNTLLTLEEPYRSTVSFRFYEGLPPREIAKRMQVPVATVNTRLRRGLAQLRVKLDKSHDENRPAFCLALYTLAAPMRTPNFLDLAPKTIKLFSAKKIAAFAAAMTLLIIVPVLLNSGIGDEATEPTSASVLALPPTSNIAKLPPEPEASNLPTREILQEKPTATLFGIAIRKEGKAPLVGHNVELFGFRWSRDEEIPELKEFSKNWLHYKEDGEGVIWIASDKIQRSYENLLKRRIAHSAVTTADGSFRFLNLEEGFYFLYSPVTSDFPLTVHAVICVGAGPSSMSTGVKYFLYQLADTYEMPRPDVFALDSDETQKIDVSLEEGKRFQITVTDRNGKAIPGAEIALLPRGLWHSHLNEGTIVEGSNNLLNQIEPNRKLFGRMMDFVATDEKGKASIPTFGGPKIAIARATGYSPALPLLDAEQISHVIALEPTEAIWDIAASVVDSSGKPVPQARDSEDAQTAPGLDYQLYIYGSDPLAISSPKWARYLTESSPGQFFHKRTSKETNESAWLGLHMDGEIVTVAQVSRANPSTTIRIPPERLKNRSELILEVVDRMTGALIPNLSIYGYRASLPPNKNYISAYYKYVTPAPRFLRLALISDSYELHIGADGYGYETLPNVMLTPGEKRSVRVELSQEAKILGKVDFGPGTEDTIPWKSSNDYWEGKIGSSKSERVLGDAYFYNEQGARSGQTKVTESGEFLKDRMGTGRYRILVVLRNGNGLGWAEVQTRTGETSKVKLRCTRAALVTWELPTGFEADTLALQKKEGDVRLTIYGRQLESKNWCVQADAGRYAYKLTYKGSTVAEGNFEIGEATKELQISVTR